MNLWVSAAKPGYVSLKACCIEPSEHEIKLSSQDEPDKDLEKWFKAHVELQKRYEMTRGCPLGTLGNEVTGNDELIRQDLSLIFEVVKNRLAAFFVKEKAKGRLARQASEESMADFCIATIQGAMLMGKIKRSSQTVETTVEEAVAHLKSYLVKPRH